MQCWPAAAFLVAIPLAGSAAALTAFAAAPLLPQVARRGRRPGLSSNATDAAPFETRDLVFPVLVHRPSVPPPPGQGSPLLLFLHGAAMSGTNVEDLLGEKAAGYPPRLLLEGREAPAALGEQFTLVAPQTNRGWSTQDVTALLDALLAGPMGLGVDEDRMYVVGHSMGAEGALSAATTGRFAAVVAMSPPMAPAPDALQDVPVWLFRAKNDVVAPAQVSVKLVQGLRALGVSEDRARLTLYDNAPAAFGMPSRIGHGSYFEALRTQDLYAWLLKQRLGA